MAKRDLISEALLDAKRVKSAALANAKLALEETFQPTLQRMISSKLQEEDEEEDPEFDIDISLDGGEDEEDFGGGEEAAVPEMGFGGGEEEEETAPEEGGEDLELEALIRELEGEDGEDDMLEGEEESWSDPIETVEEGEEFGDEEDVMEGEEEYSDEDMMEAILRELEGDEDELTENEDGAGAYEETATIKTLNTENRRLRAEAAKFKKRYNEALRAITTYKKTINEVNLMNGKLMYTTKTLRSFNLNEHQQVRILEAFDRANSVREVQLVYTTIAQSFNKKPLKSSVKEGLASKPIKAVNPKKKSLNESADKDIVRWSPLRLQQLANIKPVDD